MGAVGGASVGKTEVQSAPPLNPLTAAAAGRVARAGHIYRARQQAKLTQRKHNQYMAHSAWRATVSGRRVNTRRAISTT